MTRFERLLELQAAELAAIEAQDEARILEVFELARQQLAAELNDWLSEVDDAEDRFTVQQLRVLLAQTEVAIASLQARLGQQLAPAAAARRAIALDHLVQMIETNDGAFAGEAGRSLQLEVAAKLSAPNSLLLHKRSMDRYGQAVIDAVGRDLAVAVTSGRTIRQAAAVVQETMEVSRSRALLVTRMELSNAYATTHTEGITAAAEILDGPQGRPKDPLLKRASEHIDLRNHPFSRVLNGVTAMPDEEFVVQHATVETAAAELAAERHALAVRRAAKAGKPAPARPKARVSGITWRREGATWRGMQHPAHFWDRGRSTSFRRSWMHGEVAEPGTTSEDGPDKLKQEDVIVPPERVAAGKADVLQAEREQVGRAAGLLGLSTPELPVKWNHAGIDAWATADGRPVAVQVKRLTTPSPSSARASTSAAITKLQKVVPAGGQGIIYFEAESFSLEALRDFAAERGFDQMSRREKVREIVIATKGGYMWAKDGDVSFRRYP